jgi:hypothetical protein
MGSIASLSILVVLSLTASAARADGIPPPPTCPAGTELRGCHGEGYCEPDACTMDGMCAAGLVCREVAYCMRDHFCGGGRPPPDAASSGFPTQTATRFASDGCMAGETSVPARVCISPDSPALAGADGCGCRAPGADATAVPALGVLAGLGVLLAAGARRRRHR